MKVVGARITVFKMLDQGKAREDIEKVVLREFPNTKKATLDRYFSDYVRYNPGKGNSAAADSGASAGPDDTDSNNLDSDLPGARPMDPGAIGSPVKDDEFKINEFRTEVRDTQTPPEADKLARMYADGLVSPEPVHLEMIPKVIKRTFGWITRLPFMPKKLQTWNDPESVSIFCDSVEKMIQKRIHVSSRNADVWNVGLAGTVVFTSAITHMLTGEKPDLTEEKRILNGKDGKGKKIVKAVENLENQIEDMHRPYLTADPVPIKKDSEDKSAKIPHDLEDK